MSFLVTLYKENMNAYMSFGLTDLECRGLISDCINRQNIEWTLEQDDEILSSDEEPKMVTLTPGTILSKLEKWGWLKKDFDDKINRYVYSFPEYSQLYIELFTELLEEDDSKERESILAIYSALYTYSHDKDKNNDIIKTAMKTCKSLNQLLTNMQDGIRNYFEVLSRKKNFIGIQEVLIDEINNKDSKKYAILTTTDSFYRYKESIKDLMSSILIENDRRKTELYNEYILLEENSLSYLRKKQRYDIIEEASKLVYLLEREFDLMEQKYKKLIEQKAIFAKRALARIHYIMQEQTNKEDYLMQWVHLHNKLADTDELLELTRNKIYITTNFKVLGEQSLSSRKNTSERTFEPQAINTTKLESELSISNFIPKPLYSKKEIQEFKAKNIVNGKFVTTKETVNSLEDLEKLLFLWQESTENMLESKKVELLEELSTDDGMKFTKLVIYD